MQTLTSRGVGDAAAGLGLHFLHMSEGPFSHDAGHIMELIVWQTHIWIMLPGVVNSDQVQNFMNYIYP